jgi:hypothetical protein
LAPLLSPTQTQAPVLTNKRVQAKQP